MTKTNTIKISGFPSEFKQPIHVLSPQEGSGALSAVIKCVEKCKFACSKRGSLKLTLTSLRLSPHIPAHPSFMHGLNYPPLQEEHRRVRDRGAGTTCTDSFTSSCTSQWSQCTWSVALCYFHLALYCSQLLGEAKWGREVVRSGREGRQFTDSVLFFLGATSMYFLGW